MIDKKLVSYVQERLHLDSVQTTKGAIYSFPTQQLPLIRLSPFRGALSEISKTSFRTEAQQAALFLALKFHKDKNYKAAFPFISFLINDADFWLSLGDTFLLIEGEELKTIDDNFTKIKAQIYRVDYTAKEFFQNEVTKVICEHLEK